MWIITVLFLLLLIISTLKFIKIWNYWKNKGIPYVNVFDCFHNYAENMFRCNKHSDKLQSIYERYPNERYIGAYQFFQPFLLIRDAQLAKRVNTSDFSFFRHHNTFITADVDEIWLKTLFGMTDRWSKTKQAVNPLVSINRMRHMIKPISDVAHQLIEYLKMKEGEPHDVLDLMRKSGNDVFAKTFFGVTCNSHLNENNDFFEIARKAAAFEYLNASRFWIYYFCPILVKILGWKVFSSQVYSFFRSIILEKVKLCSKKEKIPLNFSHIIIATNKRNFEGSITNGRLINVNEEDIVTNGIILSIAGIDSVGYTQANLCYELGQNPHIQENIYNEIQKTVKQCNGELTYEALDLMKYLESVILETLRLHPPTCIIDRRCVKPYVIEPANSKEKTLNIDEGCGIWILHKSMQRDAKYYPNPEKFNPERFAMENALNAPVFFTFGSGPRKCLGFRYAIFQMKCFLVHVLYNYKVSMNLEHKCAGIHGTKLQFEQRRTYLPSNAS